LARADAGNRFEKSRISLDDLLRDVIRQMASQAGEVTIESGEIEPVAVEANVVWLKQLFLILIDNALKYTPSGGVVRLSLVRDDARAIVRVSDNGIGIAAEDLPHIFDRFYRADKARARDEGGAGLGLSIARWIAQQHDAVLEAESAQGSGTTFILSIAAVE
ncbi:MAG TPA: sensor histidine kinase, partial [Chloroflexota bacterium]